MKAKRRIGGLAGKCSALLLWIFGSLAAVPSLAGVAFAQDITNTTGVHDALCNIFSVMFTVLIAVSVIMVLVAAYEYITAADDTEKIAKARRMILYAACGVVAALLARGFPAIIASLFRQNTYLCGEAANVILH